MDDLFKIKYGFGVVIEPQQYFKKLNDLDQLEMLVTIEKELIEYRQQVQREAWEKNK